MHRAESRQHSEVPELHATGNLGHAITTGAGARADDEEFSPLRSIVSVGS
jgi:hypothetical protein